MKKLKLDIFKDIKMEIIANKNNNELSIIFNGFVYVEQISDDELPHIDFLQYCKNSCAIKDYKILDYTTLILKKVKNINNKIDVITINGDELYVIIRQTFIHHNISEQSCEYMYFKIHNKVNEHLSSIMFNYPTNNKNIIAGSRPISNGLIGTYDGNYIRYIQCISTNINTIGDMLIQNYKLNEVNELIQNGDIVFLTPNVKKNKIYNPHVKFKTISKTNFKELSKFYDNVYYYNELTNKWMFVNYRDSIYTTQLSEMI